ncbi:MAG: DUF1893 domain-containing protein [Bacteroidaceae bacterium]|nr:DUF1893 domain-containing protein [Bacteroidaceae bacterium]
MNNLKEYLHTHSSVLGVAQSANGKIHEFHSKGIIDLYTLITEQPSFLIGGMLADEVIGRGAALLLVKAQAKEVWADMISEPALEVLTAAGIPVSFDKAVPYIINRTQTGMCPVEKITQHVTDPDEAYRLIGQFLAEVNAPKVA